MQSGPPLSPVPRLGLIKIWVAEMDQMGGGSILRGSDEIGVACECHWEYGLSEGLKSGKNKMCAPKNTSRYYSNFKSLLNIGHKTM